MKNIKKIITNRRNRLAIIAFVAVIGFIMLSCPSPTGDDNEDPGEDLGKKAGAAVSVPVLASKTQNSITIKPSAFTDGNPGEQTIEYAINVVNSVPEAGWQDGLTISGLSPSTTYWIFARSKSNATRNAGKANAGLLVATDPIKEAGAVASTPELVSKTSNSITIKAIAAFDNGQTVEYAKNGTNSAPPTGWQDGLTFSGLSPNTTYWIFARSKSNVAYNAGTASIGLLVTTDPDTTPPMLSGGSINRTGNITAFITFTTDEAGTAYYSQLAGGAAAPTSEAVTADNTIGSVIAGMNVEPVTLTPGVRDIYVVVEDAAGNKSSPLKIEAPAYVAMFYNIGDIGPGGGIIFYVNSSGFTVEGYTGAVGSFAEYTAHYLEAAPSNLSTTAQWGAYEILISGVTTFTSDALYDEIGNGRKDTMIIVSHLGTSETGRAAQLAAAASFSDLNDWFLPSYGELNLLYVQRNLTGIGITSGIFWSSSQYNAYAAWHQNFTNGDRPAYYKNSIISVRAIRAF